MSLHFFFFEKSKKKLNKSQYCTSFLSSSGARVLASRIKCWPWHANYFLLFPSMNICTALESWIDRLDYDEMKSDVSFESKSSIKSERIELNRMPSATSWFRYQKHATNASFPIGYRSNLFTCTRFVYSDICRTPAPCPNPYPFGPNCRP